MDCKSYWDQKGFIEMFSAIIGLSILLGTFIKFDWLGQTSRVQTFIISIYINGNFVDHIIEEINLTFLVLSLKIPGTCFVSDTFVTLWWPLETHIIDRISDIIFMSNQSLNNILHFLLSVLFINSFPTSSLYCLSNFSM